MARDRGQVNRMFRGIRATDPDPLVAEARLYRGDQEVGQLTSTAFSPRLNCAIGLAYLRRGSQETGTELVVEPGAEQRRVVVADLPLVGLQYERKM